MAKVDYFSVDVLRESGCVAQINAKERGDGFLAYSFSLFREFERDGRGPTQRTVFLSEQNLPALRRLLDVVERRIQEDKERVYSLRRQKRA